MYDCDDCRNLYVVALSFVLLACVMTSSTFNLGFRRCATTDGCFDRDVLRSMLELIEDPSKMRQTCCNQQSSNQAILRQ